MSTETDQPGTNENVRSPGGSQDLSVSDRSSRQVKQEEVRELAALKISIPWISIKGWGGKKHSELKN